MTNSDRDQLEVADVFERTLLDSARLDGVSPEAAERAWLKFSGLIATAAVSAGGVQAVAARNAGGLGLLSRLGAGKSLLLGALGGSALTFAWIGVHRASPAPPKRAVEATLMASPSAVVVPPSNSGNIGAPSVEVAPLHAVPPRARLASNAVNVRQYEPALPSAGHAGSTAGREVNIASTLSAEVAALDAARTATRMGAYDRALELLGQYQSNFPAGVLRADAAVAMIEALYEKGDRTEASRLAAQFLAQFPNDPHSATVRRLLTRRAD